MNERMNITTKLSLRWAWRPWARWLLGVGVGVWGLVGQALAQPIDAITDLGIVPLDEVVVGGLALDPERPPPGLRAHPDLGILTNAGVAVQRIHAWPPPLNRALHPRIAEAPGGDYLVLFTAGRGFIRNQTEKVNDHVMYRSSDEGETWQGPFLPWRTTANTHSGLLFRDGDRLYAIAHEKPLDAPDVTTQNGHLLLRHSPDGGRTWSEPRRIRPQNDPGLEATAHNPGCVTARGTWIVPAYDTMQENDGGRKRIDRQYVLRSEDRGGTWTLLPGARPHGWSIEAWDYMIEAQAVCPEGEEVLLFARAPGGHVYLLRSGDDGRTWSEPEPLSFVHPNAPPMVFLLADGETLAAFHHNRYNPDRPFDQTVRNELWVSLSSDGARTWSEPRFVAANMAEPGDLWDSPSISYDDLLVDGADLHLIMDYQYRQVLHLQFTEAEMRAFPTQEELRSMIKASNAGR